MEELQKSQETVAAESLVLKRNKMVFDAEAEEFLKMLKQSKYAVIERWKKAPAQVSALSLLMVSNAHRNVCLKF